MAINKLVEWLEKKYKEVENSSEAGFENWDSGNKIGEMEGIAISITKAKEFQEQYPPIDMLAMKLGFEYVSYIYDGKFWIHLDNKTNSSECFQDKDYYKCEEMAREFLEGIK